MKNIRALHIASFNGNIGDNANHNGFRNRLKEIFYCAIEYDEIEIREFYQSWNIRNFNSSEFIDLCNSYDLVIIGGGNFFELKWDYSYTGTTINIRSESLNKIDTPILFNGVGCDIAKGASESAISKFKSFLEIITNDNKYLVSVRNDGSYETIKKLYGDRYSDKIYRVPDGAFFLETKKFDFPELNNSLKSIGINIVSDMKDIRFNKELKDGIEYNDFINSISEELNTFLKINSDYQIILFPHIYSDLNAINNLLEQIDDRYRRTRIVIAPCLTGSGSEEYIFGLYKECELILGMRFHSNVCSIAQNIPTIALSSYKKIIDLYKELNLSDRVIEINKKGFQKELSEQVKYTIINKEDIKLRYKMINENVKNESTDFYKKIKEWTEENGLG
ncbi:polysaccharide pyruvyl transferase family protein [Aquibacillus albus]|uniref:Polysaccharide pyruvyl transferase WcaK-like protein n=1 Tax=Aquibacillus albus TaxID=1168171 RepID=A0ABS2N4X6_9BACI|nr:polysaccharide pyruvyl transferase family protein [Aquibacillus albus]MBM7573190.1 polysaccharide pyruvyl transferase WcaK-like protein [Aquibacillus albus]